MFARVLAGFRFVLVIAVLGCLAIAVGLLLFGAVRVVATATELVRELTSSEITAKKLTLEAMETIDLFLIATVAYITAVGLYTLFISREVPLPVKLGIDDLDDLKEKVIGVLVVALGVLFLGEAASLGGSQEVLFVGAGVAVVIASLTFFLRQGINHESRSGPPSG